jgi:hypothetical protein
MRMVYNIMNIEEQLERIKDKNSLHKFIDNLEDSDQVFIIVERRKGPGTFHTFGDITYERILWMIEKFKHFYLLRPPNEP